MKAFHWLIVNQFPYRSSKISKQLLNFRLSKSLKMSFKELYCYEIQTKASWKKLVKVYLCTENKNATIWIDVRNYFQTETELRPTRSGICLQMNEFEQLLPFLMTRTLHSIMGEKRRVNTKPNAIHNFLQEVHVQTLEGKETSISLTSNDVKKLNFVKKEIFMFAN